MMGGLRNIKKISETELVIVIVPFTFSIIPAIWLKHKTRSKLWIHIQDFEFDLAFETGILARKNLFTKFFKKSVLFLESFLLNKATVISSISNNMLAQAEKRTTNIPVYFFAIGFPKKNLTWSQTQFIPISIMTSFLFYIQEISVTNKIGTCSKNFVK